MRKWWLIALVAFSCNSEKEEVFEPEITAQAQLFSLEALGDNQYDLTPTTIGMAAFAQDGEVVRLHIQLEGMTPNTFKAVHIHEGTVEAPGRHWNRGSFFAACDSLSLGNLWGKPFVGDVGNVPIDADGNGEFIIRTDLWRLNSGDAKDLVGKPIIIHDMPQDFVEECSPFHDHDHLHSNPKIAGGTVALISEAPVGDQASAVSPSGARTQIPDFLICN